MKFLKLDARFEDARRVARCLVGSRNELGDELISLHCGLFLFASTHRSECSTFLVDILRFCPFVAMREQVRVNAVRIDGTIVEIGYGHCSIYTADGVDDRIPLRNIRLDLGYIERGELEGCEIVGVGE